MTTQHHGMSRFETLSKHCADAPLPPLAPTFGRIGPENPVSGNDPHGNAFNAETVTQALIALTDEMRHTAGAEPESTAEAGMTFFGQFVDHDVTFDATSEIGRLVSIGSIRNVRTPSLDLDCVYGAGPEASPHLYHPDHGGFLLFGNSANPLDLARNQHGTALIGDPRNDENQVISQLQGAFVCLHNIVMTKVLDGDTELVGKMLAHVPASELAAMSAEQVAFQTARRACRLHYQWVILHGLLPAFVDADVLDNVKAKFDHGSLPHPFKDDSPVMPMEFSGAAYRFGHATVQSQYRLANGGPLFDLFQLGRAEFTHRPADRNIEFDQFFDVPGSAASQRARPVGTNLADAIYILPFVGSGFTVIDKMGGTFDVETGEARKLPLRNMIRDRFTLQMASGQQIARRMHVAELPAPDTLKHRGITKTPLWFYCLQEGNGHGGKLGPVGGTLVATVLMRLLHLSPDSLPCSAPDFVPCPQLGADADGTYSMGHLLRFVENNRAHIAHAGDLVTG